jgi:hypothetical protein
MLFSERQLSMAIALAQFGIKEPLIVKAVTLDRIDQLKNNPIERYLQQKEIEKQTSQS